MSCNTVHPHVCGERLTVIILAVAGIGSSPRVWGTLGYGLDNLKKHRFIPTCVGNACGLRAVDCYVAVHPHVCGERGLPIYN